MSQGSPHLYIAAAPVQEYRVTQKRKPGDTPESVARAAIEAALSDAPEAPLVAASEMLAEAFREHPEWADLVEKLLQPDPTRRNKSSKRHATQGDSSPSV